MMPSMTTLVATRQALELLSMSDQQKRRSSKRLAGRSSEPETQGSGSSGGRNADGPAAAADYEQDDDFQFVRKSKRAKTEEQEPPKKTGRGRPSAKDKKARELSSISETPKAASSAAAASATGGTRKSSRRKPSIDAPEEPQPPQQQAPKRATRQSKRLSGDDAEEAKTNGASRKQRGRAKGRRAQVEEAVDEEEEEEAVDESPPQAPVESTKIALPMSDTPIINRNKDMRRKGNSNRRSSLGSRGRRASSLIESGQTAIPHREVDPAEFYKHIEADLVEPRRMKQLLMWCGERALAAKPPLGTPNSDAILGARAIQDQILKDFGSRSEFSDWFSRDDDVPKAKVILKPNPRNSEMDEKLASLQEKIDRLRREKEAWLSMKKLPPEQPPLFTSDEPEEIVLPDFDLLDEDDGKLRGELADEANSFAALRSRTESRLRKIQSSLELQVDQFADNVHKLEQRVTVAGKEADRVLKLSSLRLREREQREKTSAGTRDMPLMEVLRNLGSILPEGNGG
ncbi:pgaD-like domain-containing protein [Purpureocillium lavendulum]|uniref:PgaD-like domain-containing protein n=1 Tax=Purpureocillium lavendulum TaxID=1247861 RepID=A0AB34FNF5_9HYPO|nr:pgaD-like domain-containing protein [Purpureocillium lavendulum]